MTNWHDFLNNEGKAPPWPYPVDYDKEREIYADVLVLGGGIAGCWAAISALANSTTSISDTGLRPLSSFDNPL